MDTDRNLLFGVLALQAGVLDAEQFADICTLWSTRKQTALADLLLERGWLTAEDRHHLDYLLERKLQKHGDDARASLAAAADESARRLLAGITDSVVRHSLASLPPPAGHLLISTIAHSSTDSSGRYTLTRLHAQGGLGQVWLARDGELGREVALKQLRPERADHPHVCSRFLEEARITGQLEHPGIVPVYELSQHPQTHKPFYTMRFIQGRTLTDSILAYHERRGRSAEGPLELRSLLNAFVAVCNAVAYAHSRGVVHRDLKGQNIILGDFGEVLVLDWGLAKVVGRPDTEETQPVLLGQTESREETVQGQVLGTPAYMAPEQAQGRVDLVNPRTDVYGLGAILYEILTGQPPFSGESTQVVLRKVCETAPARPSNLHAGLPQALEAICLRALAKRQADRYSSAGELAHEIQHWLADEPVAAYRERLPARLGRWARRHRSFVAGAAALLLTAVIALTVSSIFIEKEKNRAEQNYERAEGLRQVAEDKRAEAEQARQEQELTLADLHTANGLASADRAEPAEASLWFALAARLSHNNAQRAAANAARARSWARQAHVPVHALPHPGHILRQIAFNPKGDRLLTVSAQRRCVVWDLAREQPLPWLPGDRAASCAVWSPDGKSLALGTPTGEVLLLRSADGKLLHRAMCSGPVATLAFHPDGRLLATGGASVRFWDVTSGRFVGAERKHPRPVFALAFNSRGDRLATACEDNLARVFDVPGKSDNAEPLFAPIRHYVPSPVSRASFRPEVPPVFIAGGRGLLTITGSAEATWWDAESGKSNRKLPFALRRSTPNLTHLGQSPDGRHFFLAGFSGAQIWNAETGLAAGPALEHVNNVNAAVFTPDGQALLTACEDTRTRFWPIGSSTPLGSEIRLATAPHEIICSANGELLATAQDDGFVRVWSLPNGNLRNHRMRFPPGSAARLGPDGRHVIASGHEWWWIQQRASYSQVFDIHSGRPTGSLLNVHPFILMNAVLSPDGRRAATVASLGAGVPSAGATTGRLQIWDWRTGKALLDSLATPSLPRGLAYSPDGKWVATICEAGQILVADAEGRLVASLPNAPDQEPGPMPVPGVCFTPDNRYLVSWGPGNESRAWHTMTWKPAYPPFLHEGRCQNAAVSRDSRYFVTANLDRLARVWDLETGQLAASPLRHPDWVFQAVFSPDGSQVLTSCRDGRARLWDWRAGRLLCPPLKHTDEVFGVTFTPDGRWLITAGRDGSARVWDPATGTPISPRYSIGGVVGNPQVTPDGTCAIVSGMAGIVLALALEDLKPSANWSIVDLVLLGELLSGHQLREGEIELTRLTTPEWLERWRAFHGRHPDFGLLQPSERLAWHRQEVQNALQTNNPFAALWHLEYVRKAEPNDWQLAYLQGVLHAQLDQWSQAEMALAVAKKLNPEYVEIWYNDALVRVAQGKQREYHEVCQAMLERFGSTKDPLTANRLLYACVLAPGAVDDSARLVALAQNVVTPAWFQTRLLGPCLFRAGCYKEALQKFEEDAKRAAPRAWDLFFLAMIYHHLGHAKEAQRHFDQGAEWMKEANRAASLTAGASWWAGWPEMVESQTLRSEAEGLLRSRKP